MSEIILTGAPVATRAKRRKPRNLTSTTAVAAIMVALVALWQIAAARGWINGQLFGSPAGIYKTAQIGLTQGTLVSDTLVTLYETVIGLVVGAGGVGRAFAGGRARNRASRADRRLQGGQGLPRRAIDPQGDQSGRRHARTRP